MASENDPAGNVTDYTYDPNGHLLTTTLATTPAARRAPDAPPHVTEESRAYDPAGRLASVTDAMGRVTSYAYTDDGLTASVTAAVPAAAAATSEEADTYDPAGNLTAKVTNNGATTTDYAVDAADRVTSQTVDPNGLDRVTAYTYDPDDHVATQTRVAGQRLRRSSPPRTPTTRWATRPPQTIHDPGAEGPAAWWTLTQTSGTTVSDTSGTGNPATATSGVTWTGSGAELPGSDGQEITTRGPVVDTTGSFSVWPG